MSFSSNPKVFCGFEVLRLETPVGQGLFGIFFFSVSVKAKWFIEGRGERWLKDLSVDEKNLIALRKNSHFYF